MGCGESAGTEEREGFVFEARGEELWSGQR